MVTRVTDLSLGPLGLATGLTPPTPQAAAAAEEFGFSTLWLTGGSLPGLHTFPEMINATSNLRVASGILAADKYDAASVSALYADHSDRFVVGLGSGHGPQPLSTCTAFLDELDSAVPKHARMLAALGPRMLEIARDRAAGAVPVFITPEYAAEARRTLGDGPVLAVEQVVVLSTDPEVAREIARGLLKWVPTMPNFLASFRRMGFTDDEIDTIDNRLVDAVVAWGDESAIETRVKQLRAAGADHVSLTVISADMSAPPIESWRRLAPLNQST